MKQKNRRTLELQPRSYRLLEREENNYGSSKEKNIIKNLTSLFQMLKCLIKRGMPFQSYLEQYDKKKNGTINKKIFFKILNVTLLPFTLKEYQDIVSYYTIKNKRNSINLPLSPSNSAASSFILNNPVENSQDESDEDFVNYYKFLQDGALLLQDDETIQYGNNSLKNNSSNSATTSAAASSTSGSASSSKKTSKFKKISGLPEGYDDYDDKLFFNNNDDEENVILFNEDENNQKNKKNAANSTNNNHSSSTNPTSNNNNSNKLLAEKDLNSHTKIFQKLKNYIIECMTKLNKEADEIYKCFARWDHLGKGTITTTQFFRVLGRLHINLSDNDQDFLVELLENNMGRIDFERIVLYCLESNDSNLYYQPINSNANNHQNILYYSEDYNNSYYNNPGQDNNDETLSAVSIDGNTSSIDLKSHTTLTNSPQKNSLRSKRPQTASLSRPYSERLDVSFKMFNNSPTNTTSASETTTSKSNSNMMTSPLRHLDSLPIININTDDNKKKMEKNRPISALARVSSHEHQKRSNENNNSNSSRLHRDNEIIVNLPDDSEVIYGEEKYLPPSNDELINQVVVEANNNLNQQFLSPIQDNYYYRSNQNDLFLQQQQFIQQQIQQLQQQQQQLLYMHQQQNQQHFNPNNHYYNFPPSPSNHLNHQYNNQLQDPQYNNSFDILSSSTLSPTYFPSSNLSDEREGHRDDEIVPKRNNNEDNEVEIQIEDDDNDEDYEIEGENTSPSDHLILLAHQILTAIKEILIIKYRKGKSIKELYYFFDRNNQNFFNNVDLINASKDLNIEISSKVSKIMIKILGRDSKYYVTYGEFCVFILDSDHSVLEWTVVEQVAQLLEQQGRDYIDWIIENFLIEYDENYNENVMNLSENELNLIANGNINDSRCANLKLINFKKMLKNILLYNKKSSSSINDLFLNRNSFSNALKKSGLILTPSELSRLHDRFDLYGNDQCSILRFILMIRRSKSWKHALNVLKHQDQAIKESKIIRDWINKLNEKVSSSGSSATAIAASLPPCPHPSLLNILPQLSEELISMCEYLGIGIISEPNMIWIASDALKAPLPVNWTAQKDSQGRTYFYNQLTNQSRWEHPLDPHFRNLRDKYRQSASDNEQSNEEDNINLPPDGVRRINPSRTEHHPPIKLDTNAKGHTITRPKLENYLINPAVNDLNTSSNNSSMREVNKIISSKTKFRPQSATPEIVMTYKADNESQNKQLKNDKNSSNLSQSRPLSAPLHRSSLPSTSSNLDQNQITLNKNSNNDYHLSSAAPTSNLPHLPLTSTANSSIINQQLNQFQLKPNQKGINNSNPHNFAQAYNLVEQVYSAPYFPTTNNKSSNMTNINPSTFKSSSNPSSSRANPLSSTGTSSNRPQSAVDRIVSIGKISGVGGVLNNSSPSVLGMFSSTTPISLSNNSNTNSTRKLNSKEKLTEMLQGNIIEKLDNRLIQSLR